MDKPIFCRHYKNKISGDSDKLDLLQRLHIALLNDSKTVFMNLIKDPGFEGVRQYVTVDRIFGLDALEIGIAVLNGEAKDLIPNKLKKGMNPLRLATISFAPRLTDHFLRMGSTSTVDDSSIALSSSDLLNTSELTLFNLLWRLCSHFRKHVEIIRMFVQSDEQREWAREEVLKCAQYGKPPKLAALFLAAPELFSKSLLGKLNNQLNRSELGTHIKKQLLMLLDVFHYVGHPLATYIRLEEFAPKFIAKKEIEKTMLDIDFFLREVAYMKHGELDVDYYLSFFENGKRNSDDDKVGKQDSDDYRHAEQVWDIAISKIVGNNIYCCLPIILQGTGVKRHQVFNRIPTLKDQIPDRADNLRVILHNHEQFTLEEYETIPEEKRMASLSLNEKTKGDERKIDVKEFQSMQLGSKKKNDDELFIKLDSEKDKRRDAAQREKKSKKDSKKDKRKKTAERVEEAKVILVYGAEVVEEAKPVEGETHYRSGGHGRKKGRVDRGKRYVGGGGYAKN